MDWVGDSLIDWTGNRIYYSPKSKTNFSNKYSFGNRFNGIKSINESEYVVIYEKLGTKGLVLRNGELIREINRSYYQSDVYEYPIELLKDSSDNVFLIHCPEDYNRIEVELLETGKIITKSTIRKTKDIFHSRLQGSSDGKFLLSAGWVWHPFDILVIIDIEKALSDPTHLDKFTIGPNINAEVSSARFIDNTKIAITTSIESFGYEEAENALPPNHLGIYDIVEDTLELMLEQQEPLGNIFPIDRSIAWDFFDYPKIIDLNSGNVIAKLPDIDSGKQNSSIIHHLKALPQLALSKDNTKAAVSNGKQIEFLEWIT